MKKFTIACLSIATVGLTACGNDSDNDNAGHNTSNTQGIQISVSGLAASHPINGLGGTVDFTQLNVAVADPIQVLANPDAKPLAGSALSTEGCAAVGACPFGFEQVDIAAVSFGLVTVVSDQRGESDRKWLKTVTGIASGETVATLKSTADAALTDVRAFAISRAAEGALATLIAAASGQTLSPGDLEAKGFVVGLVLDSNRQPVQGAHVSVADNQASNTEVYYLADNFSAATQTATGTNGVFIVKLAPGVESVPLTTVSVHKDGSTWNPTPMATAAGGVLVLNIVAVAQP